VPRQVQVKLDEVYVSLYAKNEISRDTDDLIFYGASGEVYVGELKNNTDTDESIIDWTENLRFLDSSKFMSYSVKPTAYFYQMRGRSGRVGDQSEYLLSPKDHPALDWIGEILDLNAVINRHDRLIIQGDPGSGKTTLLHFLALKHAQALYDGLKEASPEFGKARFPILIRISEYIENGAWKEYSLSEFLAKSCVLHECPADGLEDLLRLELEKGNCLVLLDGLDEVVSTDERRGMVRRIEDFVRRHAEKANRFVITSRIAGYSSAPLGEPFARYTILEMRETQIQRFLERWCQAVEDAQTPDLPPSKGRKLPSVRLTAS
jgi:predicted NACHT family NTPase